jgi:hypothetical protein
MIDENRTPVVTLAELDMLDDAEILEGYEDGLTHGFFIALAIGLAALIESNL